MKKDTKILKVGIFSPYLNILGGGERYILSIARALSRENEVYLYADKQIKKSSFEKFGIVLKRTHFLPVNILYKQNFLKRYYHLRQYDLFLYMTDGSIFFPGAKKNFLLIQSPLHIPEIDYKNRLKLSSWQIICYSQFMKDIISKRLGNRSKIFTLAPCIDLPNNKKLSDTKENIILSVGRFFPFPHNKKHLALIDIFKSGYDKYFYGWKLVIAGGLTEEGGRQILAQIKEKTKEFPIEIMVNLPSSKLLQLYQKAKIYWHAAGMGEDLEMYPEKAEHFGIAPLEAMAYGAVPVVFNGGGLKDIITDGQGGYLWNSKEELIDKTYSLIIDDKLWQQEGTKAKKEAENYTCDKFYEKLEKIITG